ncbi:hypothetical protein KR767_04205 [Luteibacter anthropi]|uniref:hypothetical protein n=1 Tax=Luteibacter anthropi TaxID=564369 RepID=UPI002032A2FC|nr:hypothetical protein [Luteibacter anthropi]URX63280.1 hypothetical protein KR767_04205 [Luteibacter anthropi]
MHANSVVAPSPSTRSALVAVGHVRHGQHFVRSTSTAPSEVFVPISYAGAPAEDTDHTWAVVVAVNKRSQGYVPGQLIKLDRAERVRLVAESRHPVFVLEG